MTERQNAGTDCFINADENVPAGSIVSQQGGEWVVLPNASAAAVSDEASALVVLTGLEAGMTVSLAAGPILIGRSLRCDIALADQRVSAQHAVVWPSVHGRPAEVEDLQSTNGTLLNGSDLANVASVKPATTLAIGPVDVRIVNHVADRAADLIAGPDGRIRFNRPPRIANHQEQDSTLTVPTAPRSVIAPRPFRVGAFVLPLVASAIMVKLTHNAMFAVFMALSPLMMIGNFASDRKNHRSRLQREAEQHVLALYEFELALAEAAVRKRERLQRRCPDIAEILRRAMLPSRLLWGIRPDDPDFMVARIGTGDISAVLVHGSVPPALEDLVDTWSSLPDSPIPVDFTAGRVVGFVGDLEVARAVVRSILIQIATLHGPADVVLGLVSDTQTVGVWDWLKWLPHVAAERVCVLDSDEADADLVDALGRPSQHLFVIVDLTASSFSSVQIQKLRAQPRTSVLIFAAGEDSLPASCTDVVCCEPDATLTTSSVGTSNKSTGIATALTHERAVLVARALAQFADPEVSRDAVELPGFLALSALLLGYPREVGESAMNAYIRQRWDRNAAPVAILGVSASGPLMIDLAVDGPHCLLGGTTGSGKSELLRTFVISLALDANPEELTFVFVDYKGGSAFDACVALPHCVGIVTDLDEYLSSRAVQSLEAELRYRERTLRAAECSDRDSYARIGSPIGSMPRLVVMVDEFATLKAELPEFVDALVDIAQRGRSLGVHLVLATQRPTGIVSDHIRANTELKIALRMQERSDSLDVLGAPDAALLPKRLRGRALLRSGPEPVAPFQAAYTGGGAPRAVSDSTTAAKLADAAEPRPFRLHNDIHDAGVGGRGDRADSEASSELRWLVERVREVFGDGELPRRPWVDEPSADLSLDLVPRSNRPATLVHVGLVDDPANQCLLPLGWNIEAGNLALLGNSESVSSALRTIAAAISERPLGADAPADTHIYVLSVDRSLDELLALPHCGDVVVAADRERTLRLVRNLSQEMASRSSADQSDAATRPRIILLVHGIASFKQELDDLTLPNNPWEQFVRVLIDGPKVGIVSVVAVERASMLVGALSQLAAQRWIFDGVDRMDYGLLGVRTVEIRPLRRGECIDASCGLLARVAQVRSAFDRRDFGSPPRVLPKPVGLLPEIVPLNELVDSGHRVRYANGEWVLPVGIDDADLDPAFVHAFSGEHILVCGAPRSGRSNTLAVFAELAARSSGDVAVRVVAAMRSPLRALERTPNVRVVTARELFDELANIDAESTPLFVAVDDAELVDDPDGVLKRVVADESLPLLIVAAVRSEILRGNYAHWTRLMRRSRLSVLLRPTEIDADFCGIAFQRRGVPTHLGRAVVHAASGPRIVQIARSERIAGRP